MRILVLGGGLMGPAAAFNAMADPDVTRVTICDASDAQLEACREKLAPLEGGDKLDTVQLDLADEAAAAQLLGEYDVAVGALPWRASVLAIRAAFESGTPLVDLAIPDYEQVLAFRQEAEARGRLVILGCGLEPGLTEIVSRHLAQEMERIDELYIKCGGIPEVPAGPLGYKIVFGGRQMPLHESDALVVRDGKLEPVPRYSDVERAEFADVGECEAWHEGFMPWLLELPELKGLQVGTQKTLRWPGYAAKVTVLKEMGLLSEKPVQVGNVEVAPKALLDVLLYPRVRLEEGERDITLFRVEAVGEADGHRLRVRVDMVDRYDEVLGFTSMARTTSFTGAIVARMVARGDLAGVGVLPPEQLLTGPLYERLMGELDALGIRFETVE